MKNKHKILALVLIMVAVGGFAYFYNDILDLTGLSVSPSSPDSQNFILKAEPEFIRIEGDEWSIVQRYTLDDPDSAQFCSNDCVIQCGTFGGTVYDAYIRRWGECMCKCESG